MTPDGPSSKPVLSNPRLAPPPDFAFRMEATFSDVAVIGMVPEGFRVDAHYDGRISEGPLAGAIVRGVDYLVIRSDGVSVLDIRETITTRSGHRIAARAQGYGWVRLEQPTAGEAAPPTSADAGWPDRPTPLLGVAACQTSDPEFLWMNEALLVFSGTANLGSGKLEAAGRVMTPEMALGTPGA